MELNSKSLYDLKQLANELETEAYLHADTWKEDIYLDKLEAVKAAIKSKKSTPVYWTDERLAYLKANIQNIKSAFPEEHLPELIGHLLKKEWFEVKKGKNFILFRHGTRTINFYTWEGTIYITYHAK